MAVGVFLLRNHGDIRDADAAQDPGDAFQTGTVQGRVDHFQVRLAALGHTLSLDRVQEGFQAVLADGDDPSRGPGILFRHDQGAVKHIHLLNLPQNRRGGLQGDLAAVGAVDLVAVVLGRVVAGGNADARAGFVVAHGPA